MGTMAVVQTRVEETVKLEVEEVLKREGLSLSEAFRFFLERTAQEKAIPSEVFRPNAETIVLWKKAAMVTSHRSTQWKP